MDATTQQQLDISQALATALARLEGEFGATLLGSSSFRGELTVEVAWGDLPAVCAFCRDQLAFERLDSYVGNHFPARREAPFELVAHLTSVSQTLRLRLKTRVAEGDKPATLTTLWPSADWDEREIWEMFGIEFAGHPNLIRLLTVPEFEGFPLRKDFPVRGTIGGRIRRDLKGLI
jgi:NADH-quinone oxidoreductase subunit C